MTDPDYRAMCAELVEAVLSDDSHIDCVQIARRARALLAQPEPQPVPVSERLPEVIEQALIKFECALSDIAEGEAEENEGDPLQWAEKRAADALARIRPVMQGHGIRTSEWPPLPTHPRVHQ